MICLSLPHPRHSLDEFPLLVVILCFPQFPPTSRRQAEQPFGGGLYFRLGRTGAENRS